MSRRGADEQEIGDHLSATVARAQAEAGPWTVQMPEMQQAARDAYADAARHSSQPQDRP